MSDTPRFYDIGAERAVLGSLLIDPAAIAAPVVQAMRAEDFYLAGHRQIFQAMLDLRAEGKPHNDPLLLAEKLGPGALQSPDGSPYIWRLTNDTPSALHVEQYAHIIIAWAEKRLLRDAFTRAARTFGEPVRMENVSQASSDALYEGIVACLHEAAPQGRLGPAGSTWTDLGQAIGPVQWAWPGWLPMGLSAILVGAPGAGKSALALRVAACFLRGDPWPDGTAFTGAQGAMLWCEAEAAQAVNLERARAWGLPLERILNPLGDPLADVCLDDPNHRQALQRMARRPDVRLIVVDSLSGTNQRDEKSNAILPLVQWLARLARDTGKPVLITHHPRKRSLLDPLHGLNLEQVRGSSTIVQPARVVWALDCPDPANQETRRLSMIKNNLARCAAPLGMRITEQGVAFGQAPQPPIKEKKLDRAVEVLRASLEGGPMTYAALMEEMENQGISEPTARRAKDRLSVVSQKAADGPWRWGLPDDGGEKT